MCELLDFFYVVEPVKRRVLSFFFFESLFVAGEWWAQKASEHPELQSFAIKVLSQTCEGASRYKLKRNVAEKLLLSKGVSPCEKQHLEELAFVHYNLHLQSSKLQSQTK